jgi:hypothetical protein
MIQLKFTNNKNSLYVAILATLMILNTPSYAETMTPQQFSLKTLNGMCLKSEATNIISTECPTNENTDTAFLWKFEEVNSDSNESHIISQKQNLCMEIQSDKIGLQPCAENKSEQLFSLQYRSASNGYDGRGGNNGRGGYMHKHKHRKRSSGDLLEIQRFANRAEGKCVGTRHKDGSNTLTLKECNNKRNIVFTLREQRQKYNQYAQSNSNGTTNNAPSQPKPQNTTPTLGSNNNPSKPVAATIPNTNSNNNTFLPTPSTQVPPSTTANTNNNATWNKANLTNYTSYPAPGSEECVAYNGCTWAGAFAFLDGKQSEDWVKNNNIIAIHSKDANAYKLKTLRLRQGDRQIDAVVYDMCSDSDCNGCCTKNASANGLNFLIDIEKYTMQRFGFGDGIVEWQCVDC